MSRLRSIALVEDEAVVARRLERLTRRLLGDQITSCVHLTSLTEALAYVRSHTIDLLFLDLNLQGEDGFEVLAEAVAGSFHTIIVSARHELALRAFEYGVVDFVPKPYSQERLAQALGRIESRGDDLRRQLRYLAVRKGRKVIPVPLSEVMYVQAAGDYSELHCSEGIVHLHHKTLSDLSQLLPSDYWHIHRSYIVDSRWVESLNSRPGSRYFVQLRDGTDLPVSRHKVQELRRRFV